MHDGRMIVENNYYHALKYCETTANTQPCLYAGWFATFYRERRDGLG